jgi:hypothetical protein
VQQTPSGYDGILLGDVVFQVASPHALHVVKEGHVLFAYDATNPLCGPVLWLQAPSNEIAHEYMPNLACQRNLVEAIVVSELHTMMQQECMCMSAS